MESELLSLKWNNHRTTFLHVIGTLRTKASYTDATLACDGKFYPVHKLVLSTCSEYFGAIFERTPCKSPVVVLKDIECKNLEFLLDYMYIGEVNVRQNELAALIKAAECLKIKGLAVPDEDPSVNNFPKNTRSDSQRDSSPPAKRRRNIQSGSESEKKRESSEIRSNNLDLEKCPSKDIGECPVDDGISPIKLEPLDDTEVSNFITNSNSTGVNNEKISDEGGGTGEGAKEDSTGDMQEFFSTKVETEESVHISDYSSSEFAGPSGVQNSNLSQWDSESSFPVDHLLAGSSSTQLETQQQHQQQQQQLLEPGTPIQDSLSKYPSATKDCFVLLSSTLPQKSVNSIRSRKYRKRGRTKWTRRRGKVFYGKGMSSHLKPKSVSACNEDQEPVTLPKDDTTLGESISSNGVKSSEIQIRKESDKDLEKSNYSQDTEANSKYPFIFRCLVCPYTTKLKKWMAKHQLKKHGISSTDVKYSIVRRKTETSLVLKKTEPDVDPEDNNSSHNVEKKSQFPFIFRCLSCPYTTKRRKWLTRHHLNKHATMAAAVQSEPSIEYSCPHCANTFNKRKDLRSHMKAEHSEIKPYVCSLCYFCSSSSIALKAHISCMHRDNGYRRKFECNKCFFSTNAKSILKKHLQSRHVKVSQSSLAELESVAQPPLPSSTHLPPPPPPPTPPPAYKCSSCSVCCSSESELSSHLCPGIKINKEIELFRCKDCDFETDSRLVLKEHRSIEHTHGIKIKKVYSIKKDKEYMLRESKSDDSFFE